MEDEVISYKTAKLAEKKGYEGVLASIFGCSYYNHKGELNGCILESIKDPNKKSIPAPTQSELQKWLREKHNIHITIWFNKLTKKCRIAIPEDISKVEYKTYEEALEYALYEALKLI